jgi:hypothetical protein
MLALQVRQRRLSNSAIHLSRYREVNVAMKLASAQLLAARRWRTHDWNHQR